MSLVFLDLETKKSFSELPDRDPGKLGVSLVGIYKRPALNPDSSGGFKAFKEEEFADLWPVLEKAEKIIGFNILSFDWPALNPYYPGDLLKLPTLDLLEVVKTSLGKRIRLDNLAQATLGQGKIASGWDAIQFYQEGNWEELKKYCLKDVEVTRDLYDFGQKKGFWRYKHPPDEIREFPLQWPEEEKKEGVSLTLGI